MKNNKNSNYLYRNRRIFGISVLFFLACFIILTVAINTKANDYVSEFTLPEGTETVDIIIHTEENDNGTKKPLSNVGIKMATATNNLYEGNMGAPCDEYKTDEYKNQLKKEYENSSYFQENYETFEEYYQYEIEELDEICVEPEFDYNNVCDSGYGDDCESLYEVSDFYIKKYVIFDKTNDGYTIKNLTDSEIKSTQMKTDKNGDIKITGLPEGKYLIYESEFSENGYTFLDPIKIIVKKEDNKLKVYSINNYCDWHNSCHSSLNTLVYNEDNVIRVNLSHKKLNVPSDDNSLLNQGCLTTASGSLVPGIKSTFKLEKEMYPPNLNEWETNFKVLVSSDGYVGLTKPYNASYAMSIDSYVYNKYDYNYDKYLREEHTEYYDEYWAYLEDWYSDYDNYNDFDSIQDYCAHKYCSSYESYFTRENYDKVKDMYKEEFSQYLEKKYGDEYRKVKEYNTEEYCDNYYCKSYDSFVADKFDRIYGYYYDDYDDEYLKYIEEKYGDEYNNNGSDYDSIEDYVKEKYPNLRRDFFKSYYDYYYSKYKIENANELKKEYNQSLDSTRKNYLDDLTLESFAQDKYSDSYYNYIKNKFYYNDYLEYLEEQYGDEYKKYSDKIASEYDKYEHVLFSNKSDEDGEAGNVKVWWYCSANVSHSESKFRDLNVDIIEESSDNYKVYYSSDVPGLKQEDNRYSGTVENAYGHNTYVKVVNWDKNYGDLEISKKVFGLDGEEQKNRQFNFTITLNLPLSEDLTDAYLYTKNGEDKQYFLPFTNDENDSTTKTATISLGGGESIRLIGLPVGTKYKIEEEQDSEFQMSAKNNEGVIPSADIAEVLFTNTKAKTGLLTVTKKVVDSNKEKNKTRDKEFTFTVTLSDKNINGKYGEMEFKDGVATFTLKDGESKTAINIPEGIKYEVTEKAVNGYDVTKDGDKGTIEEGVEKKVLFTNTKTILSPNTSDGILIALFVVLISLGALIYFQVNKKYLM